MSRTILLGNRSYIFYENKLQNASPTGSGYICSCPCGSNHANGDEHPSLSITIEGTKLLLHCFRECPFGDIVREFERMGILVPLNDQRPAAAVVKSAPMRLEKTKALALYDRQQMLRFAQIYREAGLNPIPIPFGEKAPIETWKEFQETPFDAKEFEKRAQSPSNLAVVCGQRWNLVVLDIDDLNVFREKILEPNSLTIEEFLELCQAESAHVEKTGKGYHVYFAFSELPSPLLEKQATLRLCGFEVRTQHTELCVVAPSYHAQSDCFYNALTPPETLKDRKTIPQEILEMLTKALEQASVAKIEWHYPLPLDEEVILPPVPLGSFPSLLREMAEEISTKIQVSVELATSVLLGTLSACVAGGWRVEPKEDYKEELGLYVLAIAPSGERKSAVFEFVTAPFLEWEAKKRKEAEEEIERTEALMEAYQGRKKEIISKLSKLERSAPERAALEQELQELTKPEVRKPVRLLVQSATIEAFEQRLEENKGLVIVLDDEPELLRVVVGGRYAENASRLARTTGALLKAHGGARLVVDRRDRSVDLARAVASITTCLQPHVARELLRDGELVASGFLARLLYCWCPPVAGERTFCRDEIKPSLKERWRTLMRTLLSARIERFPNPSRLILSPEAFERFCRYHDNEAEPLLREGGILCERKEWGSRLPGVVLRIAGILQLVEDVESTKITLENLERAIEIAGWCVQHALYAFAQANSDTTRNLALTLAKRIKEEGLREFTMRDVERWYHATADDVSVALNFLAKNGWIRTDQIYPQGAGRPSTKCFVNPLVFDSDPPKTCDKIDKISSKGGVSRILSILSHDSTDSDSKIPPTEGDETPEWAVVKEDKENTLHDDEEADELSPVGGDDAEPEWVIDDAFDEDENPFSEESETDTLTEDDEYPFDQDEEEEEADIDPFDDDEEGDPFAEDEAAEPAPPPAEENHTVEEIPSSPSPPPPTADVNAKLDYLACYLRKRLEQVGEICMTPNQAGYGQVAFYMEELRKRILPAFTLVKAENDVIIARPALSDEDKEFLTKSKALWDSPQVLAQVLKSDVFAVVAAIEDLKRKEKQHG